MDKVINCSAVILCGGKSSRMQTDKSLLPFGGFDTLSEYQYKRLQNIFSKVYISAKNNKFDFLQDKDFIQDTSYIFSPMEALKTILENIQEEYLFIIAVDIPLVSKDTINLLFDAFIKHNPQIAIAKDSLGNTHNLCGFFHKSILEIISKILQEDIHKIGYLLKNVNTLEVTIDSSDEFINVNDKENYLKANNLYKTSLL